MNTIFKKFESVGKTKEEAIKNAAPLNLRVDATQAYKKWRETQTNITEETTKEWMKEYLNKKKFTMPNDGAYIVVTAPVVDTRMRPYQVVKAEHKTRTHTPERHYILRDAAGKEVGREKTSSAALQAGKDFVTDYQEDVFINHEWVAKEGNALYATIKYTPSKGTKNAVLLVFGYEAID